MTSIADRVADQTLPRAFLATVAERGDTIALRWKDGDDWGQMSYEDYRERVARAAAGLRALGVGHGDRVVLMLRNSPEFHILDTAALFLGATPVSIYNSSSSEQVEYLVGHCAAVVGVVEDDGFLARFNTVRSSLPHLRSLGVVKVGSEAHDFTLAELMDHEPLDLDAEATAAEPGDLATIIYTSGTTGPPKGVMISHGNAVFMVESLRELMGDVDFAGKRLVSYLPMAHIAERAVSHYQHIILGTEVSTCPDPSQIGAYCREVRPHVMFGVPRVWEKFNAGVTAALAADPEKAEKFNEAVAASGPIALRRSQGTATEEDEATWAFLDEVAFRGVRELLGLQDLMFAISGAAPIPAPLLIWFRAIGVPMSEVYGMSENTGAMTWTPENIKPGYVGPAMPGTELALADDGEVICRGPHVFQGYLNDAEKTAETIDAEGWLHSGDIGEIDEDGYLRIVDRKKELIITAGGKNVSPANLEAALKMIPLVGQAAAIGDKRPFISAIVVLDPDTAKVWAAQHDVAYDSLEDLARNPAVIAEIESHLPEVMEPFNNAERVKKLLIVGEEWLPDSDLLTPTSKLKRRGVNARYADQIDALYN
ncbi:MAG: long-chain fatty acid--CoA ligase [Microthrixaceae bacterium]|nr:long-chain fatty acid--CoA ligase [Acidimicrobiales bacterium]MCB9403135.1 long-chain fatty acid--CoA ligase [Microthrixaceae bacterium]